MKLKKILVSALFLILLLNGGNATLAGGGDLPTPLSIPVCSTK